MLLVNRVDTEALDEYEAEELHPATGQEVAQRIGYEGLDSSYYINEVKAAYAAYR